MTRERALVLAGACGIGMALSALPSLASQVAVALAAGLAFVTLATARFNWVLNASWIVVASLYLAGPLGSVLAGYNIDLSIVLAIVVSFVPFALVALAIRRDSRRRLLILSPLAVLLLLGLASLAWSPNAAYGSGKLVIWLITGLIPASFVVILVAAGGTIAWRPIVVAAALTALGVILFGQALPGYPGRLTLFDANPIWEARALFIGVVVAALIPMPMSLRLALVGAMVYAGLLTVSRAPALGCVFGVCAGGMEILRHLDWRDRRVKLAWAALGLIVALGVTILLGLLDQVSTVFSTLLADPDVSSRLTFYGEGARLFSMAPVAGIGIGGFAATGLDLYPHNLVIEIGAELGVLGLAAAGAWLLLAIRGASGSPVLVGLVVATAFFSLFSGSLASNSEFWLCSALAVGRFSLTMVRSEPALAVANG
jgi:O-antigen ligase